MNSTKKRKDVTVLTGFLGSGKTTLINALLKLQKQNKKYVIENEIGEQSLDHEFIATCKEQISVLAHGCLCCSLNNEFLLLLKKLYSAQDSYDEIYIEATGVADPAAIVLPFTQQLKPYFNLKQVICVVAAAHFDELLTNEPIFRQQINFADTIVCTKTELLSYDDLLVLDEKLKNINPLATVFFSTINAIPIQQIQQAEPLNLEILNNKLTSLPSMNHSYDSFAFTYNEAFDIDILLARLRSFLWFQSEKIYRFKAIVYQKEKNLRWELQGVMKHLEATHLPINPTEINHKSTFVFIGKDLKPKGYDKMLKSCLLHTTDLNNTVSYL